MGLEALPSMKAEGRAREWRVQPREGGWGGADPGRWFEAKGRRVEVGGVCGRCGDAVPAKELTLQVRGGDKGDRWVCAVCKP